MKVTLNSWGWYVVSPPFPGAIMKNIKRIPTMISIIPPIAPVIPNILINIVLTNKYTYKQEQALKREHTKDI